jgi:hypothetical protein
MTLERIRDARELFSYQGSDVDLIPEMLALDDFRKPRFAVGEAVPSESSTADISASGDRITLPDSRPRLRKAADFRLQFDFGCSPVYECYRGSMRIAPDTGLELRWVIRPETRSLTVTTYAVCFLPSRVEPLGRTCYCARFEPLLEGESPRQAVVRVAAEEVNAAATLRRGVQNPTLIALGPVATRLTANIGDGAVVLSQDLKTGRVSLSSDPAASKNLERFQLELADEIARAHFPHPTPTKGRPATVPRSRVRELYEGFVPVWGQILSRLPNKRWPAFYQRSSAAAFVLRTCKGSDSELDALTEFLMEGERRPSPHELAVRVVSRLTGLTRDRISQLIPK